MNETLTVYTMNLSYDLGWLARKETALMGYACCGALLRLGELIAHRQLKLY